MQQRPDWVRLVHRTGPERVVSVRKFDETVVEELMTYLKKGIYKIPTSLGELETEDSQEEFRTTILLYCMARNLELEALASKIRQVVINIAQRLPSSHILGILEGLYTFLPEDDSWLNSLLEENISSTLGSAKL